MKIFPLKKGDIRILTGLLSAILITLAVRVIPALFPGASGGKQGLSVEIKIAREKPLSLAIDKLPDERESQWDLAGSAGGLTLIYAPGKGFRVQSASCPDQVCVRTGFIDKAGQSIICAPNEVLVRMYNDDAREGDALDAITR